jgi:antitoxin component YwqK of YwqJK toxin-antitoxin module
LARAKIKNSEWWKAELFLGRRTISLIYRYCIRMAVKQSTFFSKGVLLLFVVCQLCAVHKLIAAPSRALEKLLKETIYVLPPPNTSADSIRANFGENYKMLDTLSEVVNKNVHRIVIDERYFGKLPYILKYYPALQQLVLHVYNREVPPIVGSFKNLSSLKIGFGFFDRRQLYAYYSDDFPRFGESYTLPKILEQLPKLEELEFHGYLPYLPQKISSSLAEIGTNGEISFLPLSAATWKNYVAGDFANVSIPYPEIVAIGYSGQTFPHGEIEFLYESRAFQEEFPDGERDTTLPFWYEGCKTCEQPKFRKLPYDGNYSFNYANGNKIIDGNMVKGQPHGEWKWWYASGKTCEVRNYDHGREEGKWSFLDFNGDTTMVLFFENGKLQRTRNFYYTSYKIDSVRIKHHTRKWETDSIGRELKKSAISWCENDPQDTLTYCDVTYVPGQKIVSENIIYYKNVIRERTVFYYDQASVLVGETFDTENNVLQRVRYSKELSVDSVWFKNGALRLVRSYGKNAIAAEWDSTGILLMTANVLFNGYYADTTEGEKKFYNAAGAIRKRILYTNGRSKTVSYYYDSGKLKEEWSYDWYGELDVVRKYNEEGEETGYDQYKNGEVILTKTFPQKQKPPKK